MAFSPDNEWIAFVTQQAGPQTPGWVLKKIPIRSGTPVALATLEAPPMGLSWLDSTILVGQGAKGVVSVPANGALPTSLVSPDESQTLMASPQRLGGGNDLLLSTLSRSVIGPTAWDDGDIVVQPIAGGPRRMLVKGGRDARVLPSGYLVYVRETTLFVAPFDLGRNAITGESVPVVAGVAGRRGAGTGGPGEFSVSNDGALVYVPVGTQVEARTLTWVDRQGRTQPIAAAPHGYTYARLSPDGTAIGIDAARHRRRCPPGRVVRLRHCGLAGVARSTTASRSEPDRRRWCRSTNVLRCAHDQRGHPSAGRWVGERDAPEGHGRPPAARARRPRPGS
jgi:hypothetical protein